MAHARAAHMCVMRQEALQRRPQCTRQAERSPLHAAVVCKLQVSLPHGGPGSACFVAGLQEHALRESSPYKAAAVRTPQKRQTYLCCSLFADAAVVGHNREAARRSSGHFYAAGAFQHPQLFELPEEA
eukprot:366301-Chlamydomonas_euryale.AAC.7